MKITCQKNELANALQIVSKAVANKPQTPILSGSISKQPMASSNSKPPIMRSDSLPGLKPRSQKRERLPLQAVISRKLSANCLGIPSNSHSIAMPILS